MRITALLFALALSACGQSATQSSDDVPSDDALPYGAIVGVGENWSFNANPADNAASVYVEDGTEASGVWTPPQTIASGQYRLVAGDITADITRAECQLYGMSYPMSATITIPGRTLTGCAAMRWDYQLIALMPQIDACIAQSPQTTWVTYAGQTPDSAVLVRLQAGETMVDCRVEENTAHVSPRNETLPMPSEGDAIFVRAREGETANPGGECYAAPEVRGENNALLGWMMDPAGC
jgi:hypothetical protein